MIDNEGDYWAGAQGNTRYKASCARQADGNIKEHLDFSGDGGDGGIQRRD